MRHYYMVSVGTKSTGMTGNKRKAVSFAKKNGGVVYAAPQHSFDGGMAFGVDAPTFKAVGTVVADFRTPPPADPHAAHRGAEMFYNEEGDF